jgi:hypothetical protein
MENLTLKEKIKYIQKYEPEKTDIIIKKYWSEYAINLHYKQLYASNEMQKSYIDMVLNDHF